MVVPGTVLQARSEADAADFALRPIDQVSEITPVSTLTPDLEFPELRARRRAGRRAEASPSGLPASAVSGGRGSAPSGPVAQVGDPVPQQELKAPPEHEAPQAVAIPLGRTWSRSSRASDHSVVQPEAVPAPRWLRSPELEHEPERRPPVASRPGRPRWPARGRQPARRASRADRAGRRATRRTPETDAAASPRRTPEHPHADGDLPPGLTHVVEDNPDHPHAPAPGANVVTPAPSIAEPTESIFVPAETCADSAGGPRRRPSRSSTRRRTPAAPAPPVPAIRPPEYAPDELLAETPASTDQCTSAFSPISSAPISATPVAFISDLRRLSPDRRAPANP